jgi:PAS domain S-box-containing protein
MTSTVRASELDATADALVVIDQTGSILEFDPAAERMFGHVREELLGMHAELLVQPRQRAKYRAGFEHYRCAEKSALIGKGIELSALRRDGTTFPVEVAFMRTTPGLVQAFTAIIRDISERKESEHFRLLVAAVKDHAIFMLDADGHVATWNAGAQAVKGYTQSEILGKHFGIFYSAEERMLGKPELELEIAERDGRFEDVGWRVRKDGSRFWANVLISAMKDGEGKLVGFAKVTRNLTEQRQAERLEELEARRKSDELEQENRRMHEANRLKSEFLANMSHELRTPLNAIIGFADLMHRGKVGSVSDEHKEYLGDILNSSRHLLKLINGVLDLAKVESGNMEFHPEPVELGLIVAEVCAILRGLASSKQIRIEQDVAASVSAGVLDPSKLKQVLYNYLSNALKFSEEGGLVTVRAAPEPEGLVRIEVQDNGIGIREADRHRLFVEFQQLDAGMAKKYAGTGLGLALTRRIVEAQGGSVGVTSELGTGSTFWAVLPLSGDRRPSEASPDRLTTGSEAGTEPTVLVVDDDPAALRLMGATLKANGYTALCFAEPAQALRALQESTPTVVVLDLQMPDMDGFAWLDRVRALPHMQNVPVVVWTVKDLSQAERSRLLLKAQRIVLKAQEEGDVILDALRPYLRTDPPGAENAG